jgi:hypothetical protein
MGAKDAMEEKVPPTGITEKLVVPPKLMVTATQTFTVIVNVPLPLLMGGDARVMSVSLHDLAVSFAKQMSRNKAITAFFKKATRFFFM